MTVKEIVKEYLEQHGFGGLFKDTPYHCACELKDLMPCQGTDNPETIDDCEAGYKVRCDCDEWCKFHIVKEKPKEYRQAVGAAPDFLEGEKPEDVIRRARGE